MLPNAGVIASSKLGVASSEDSYAFQDHFESLDNLAVYTFPAVPIGTPSATRFVIVAVNTRTATINGVTVGGVALTRDVIRSFSNNIATLYSGVVPSGTTGDVVVTYASAGTRCGIGVWTMSSGEWTGVSTYEDGPFPAISIATEPGDLVISSAYENGSADLPGTAVWTDATEDFDAVVETDMSHTGASVVAVDTLTEFSLSWDGTGVVAVAAAYRF